MAEIENVIFDFGGVLLNWDPRYYFSKVILDKAQLDYFLSEVCNSSWNLEQDRGRTLAEGTQLLQQKFPDYAELVAQYYTHWDEMLVGDIPENVKLLKQLKGRYPLYGLTNFSTENLPRATRRFSFFELFDGIVVSGEEKLIKPDLEIYKVILERYSLDPLTALFIDDNLENCLAAESLGIKAVHYSPTTDLAKTVSRFLQF